MRGWLVPLIGVPIGVSLAMLAAVLLGLSPVYTDIAGAEQQLGLIAVPHPIAPGPPPLATAGATSSLAIAPARPPRPGSVEPERNPGLADDLLRPPEGATSQASGTGFFVSSRGAVLTAAHVVAGCRGIRVTSQFLQPSRAELVASDSENDVALLRTFDVAPPAQLSIGAPSRAASRLFVLGFPASAAPDVPTETWAGLVNAVFPHNASLITDPLELLWLQNRDIAPGYSGGPILDPATGRVVGLVRAIIDPRKAAVAYGIGMPDLSIGPGVTPLRAMLAQEVVREGVVPAGFSSESALDVARRATVHVTCWL